ncbi:Major Facilitator Superfamily protein [Candidatus Bilamarchaeum dharawalense]|uniref:Major Facilitator Superfamily protein n=1 Tax=Candidatus Bilamarchaeum dharawalense TaxID=2885759 RepID=A0A5E4LPZ7_9ARCH|nr:Major Facilitator Superfamily protein [Candidatus Bilamarchaeum dharawalense]
MQLTSEFQRLTVIFLLWNLGLAFSGYLVFPSFAALGFSLEQMLFLSIFNYLIPLIYLLVFREYDSKNSIPLGIFSVAIAYLAYVLLGGVVGAFLLFAIGALSFFLFWTPFNYFWFSIQKENASHSSLYNAIMMILGLMMPALSGLLAQQFGFNYVFLGTAILLTIAAIVAWKLAPHKKVSLHLGESLNLLSGFRTLIFLEGFYQVAPVFLITIISIQYFPKPADFGLFISLAAILSIASSFILSKISDKSKQRREFIIISAIGVALSTIFAASVNDLVWWFIAVSLVNFFRVVFFPFPLALMLDFKKCPPEIMYSREIMLNLGRSVGSVFSLILYLITGSLLIPLMLVGFSMLIYAALFELIKLKKIQVT